MGKQQQQWRIPVLLAVLCCLVTGPGHAYNANDSLFRHDVQQWFNAWLLVSRQVYHLPRQQPVTFVFFDEQHIYTTSAVTAPQGAVISGPDFAGRKLQWRKASLTDSITLPDRRRLPVGLMSFASPLDDKAGSSFFIMPLLSFWEKAGVGSEELGLKNLVTIVFLHEFSHTQQMQNFGRLVSALDSAHHFGIPFSDDIVQYLFEQDSSYVATYRRELQLFYDALSEQDRNRKRTLIQEGLDAMAARHRKFLVPRDKALPEIDSIFLTMEGMGQYSQYAWLVHPKGAALPAAPAIKGMRRGGRWWSQDEGQVLFLLLDQLSPPGQWAGKMFGTATESVLHLIRQQLEIR